MSKTDTKARILYIYKLLLEETDKEHIITIQQIIDKLEAQGISAYRKTVISDIEQLQDLGADIVGVRSSQNRYYKNPHPSTFYCMFLMEIFINFIRNIWYNINTR